MEFKVEQCTKTILRIKLSGDVCAYLLCGKERALLVDTGFGIHDLRGFVERIWAKPYDVLLTHGHFDHCGGMSQWESVYLNKKDQALAEQSVDRTVRKKNYHGEKVAEEAWIKEKKVLFKDLEEGQCFDLGDLHVTVHEAAGHTQGIVVLKVEEEHALLLGDACGAATFLFFPEASTVEAYHSTLLKLKVLAEDCTLFLRQHGTCVSKKEIIDENLQCAESILKGEDARIPLHMFDRNVYMAYPVSREELVKRSSVHGNIFYVDEKVRERVE